MINSEWLNCPGPYVQYTYNPDLKLVAIIRQFGFAFDDTFWFWIPKTKMGGQPSMLMVKRSPLWTYPLKSVPTEKAKLQKITRFWSQKKLLEASLC